MMTCACMSSVKGDCIGYCNHASLLVTSKDELVSTYLAVLISAAGVLGGVADVAAAIDSHPLLHLGCIYLHDTVHNQ